MSPSITIIVPFHRDLAQLRACLDAVASSSVRHELIVAADGAREDCTAIVTAHGGSVVVVPGPSGPAVARNRAASTASGDILLFIDSDVVAAPGTIEGMHALLARDPSIAGLFGAYDHAPRATNFMSQFKNLAHAYVHETGRTRASTFWAGLGAVRAPAFRQVGGFDERFHRPSIEDIDLGQRLVSAGFALRLDPTFRGTHLKRWTLWSAITTDIQARGIPWTQLIHRSRTIADDLNTSRALRASVVLAYGIVLAAALLVLTPWAGVALVIQLALLIALNVNYYRWFAARRGWSFAARVVPAHLLHHLCNGCSFAIGTALHLAARSGLTLPGALPPDAWPPAHSRRTA